MLRGLGPLATAFGVGYAVGSVLFAPGEGGYEMEVPPDVELQVQAECPIGRGPVLNGAGASLFCGPIPEPYSPSAGPEYFTVPPSEFWVFVFQWPPGTALPANWTHGENLRYARWGSILGPDSGPQAVWKLKPGVITVVDPEFAEAVGVPIYLNPLASPGVRTAAGPVAPPLKLGKIVVPSPGVGDEGYAAGEPSVGPNPRPRPNPNPRRAPRGVKERKVKGPLALRLLAARGLYGGVTELEDAVTAVHKALDKECLKAKGARKAGPVWDPSKRNTADGFAWRKHWNGKYIEWHREKGAYRKPTVLEKAEVLARHFDCVNLEAAIQNLIEESAEDRIYGALGKQSRKAAEAENRGPFPRGYELGPAL